MVGFLVVFVVVDVIFVVVIVFAVAVDLGGNLGVVDAGLLFLLLLLFS